jgi:hypothetical protein
MITIFVAAFAAESEAIKCYNCEVQDDRFVGLTFHDCRFSLIECPTGFDVCLKTSVNNKVTRTCGKSKPVKDLDDTKTNATQIGCSVLTKTGDSKNLNELANTFTQSDFSANQIANQLLTKQFCCDKSECNSSNTLVNNKFILAAFLFVAAFIYKL